MSLVLSLFPGIGLLDRAFEEEGSRLVLVDEADMASLEKHHWYLCNGYARCDVWSGGRRRRAYMHRMILGESTLHVDHINGDKLDNRRCNLRLVDRSKNLLNRRGATAANKSTGVRGVYVDKRDGRIYARVIIEGVQHNLSGFNSIEEASAAIAQARKDLIG